MRAYVPIMGYEDDFRNPIQNGMEMNAKMHNRMGQV